MRARRRAVGVLLWLSIVHIQYWPKVVREWSLGALGRRGRRDGPTDPLPLEEEEGGKGVKLSTALLLLQSLATARGLIDFEVKASYNHLLTHVDHHQCGSDNEEP